MRYSFAETRRLMLAVAHSCTVYDDAPSSIHFQRLFNALSFTPAHFEIVGIWICERTVCEAETQDGTHPWRAELKATTWRRFTFHPKGFLGSKNSFGSPRYLTSVGNTFEVVLRVAPLHQHARCFVALVVWNPLMGFYPTLWDVWDDSDQRRVASVERRRLLSHLSKTICPPFAGCERWNPWMTFLLQKQSWSKIYLCK